MAAPKTRPKKLPKAKAKALTKVKAKTILREGSVRGKALTERQEGFFGARAGGISRRNIVKSPNRRDRSPRGKSLRQILGR